MFSIKKILKGLSIFKEGTLNPSTLDLLPGGTAGTTTTIQGAQTANRTVTLPDNSGTVLTTASVIDLDQLEDLTANRAVVTDTLGTLTVSATTDTEVGYLSGVTSPVQTQLTTNASDISTETSARIAADALKANLTLNNILPTTSVDFNAQRIVNVADPINPQDVATKAYVNTAGTGANTTLSNLTSPTSVNQSLIPASTQDLGTPSNPWYYLYANLLTNTNTSPFINLVQSTLVNTGSSDSLNWATRKLLSGATTKLDWSGTDIDINARKIINVVDPTSAQDVATKAYVDSSINTNIGKMIKISGSTTLVSTFGGTVFYNTVQTNTFGGTPYNVGTGFFTVPISGKYLITLKISFNITYATTQGLELQLRHQGSVVATDMVWGNGQLLPYFTQITYMVDAALNDTINVSAISSITGNLTGNNSGNYLCISYLGA